MKRIHHPRRRGGHRGRGDARAREIEEEVPRASRPITARATRRPFGYWAGYGAPVAGYGRGNDPSLGHPSAAGLSRASGRCVEDLGYGRFKYCGW